MNPSTIFELATEYAKDETKSIKDTGYGCGTSFITIKLNTAFGRWAKKQDGMIMRDGYYGNILSIESPFNGTLESEKFQKAFSDYLNKNGIKAFVHTLVN